ncbi:MAG: transcriptional repressor LexA [Parolsenella sp.]|uniref:transcriptional repressor LexA n=1 Tax=Coriobacteriales TaxID=84999 RepID=UPI002A75DB30|nr:transcriptional repressor LexA [Parolsenella sp.]MCI5950607.1 transcriptional repressor LexA [Coriobacteriaceae bacterium]MDY3291690.1 transcriptional repressor LexA [Parolsenella sp.]
MPKEKITKRQQQAFEFICAFTAEHGYPPSVREIGSAIGLSSPSTVHSHLHKLEEAGYIKRDPNKPRTIEICEDAKTRAKQSPKLVEVKQDVNTNTVTLPLVGRVAAGLPILAEQNVEEVMTLPTNVVGDSSSFILRVRGESMINAGIFDGDYIVVREQHDAHNGEIVVALIEDSATVKTFYREKDRIRLQPENDTMEPIYAINPTILGRVTGLFRSM